MVSVETYSLYCLIYVIPGCIFYFIFIYHLFTKTELKTSFFNILKVLAFVDLMALLFSCICMRTGYLLSQVPFLQSSKMSEFQLLSPLGSPGSPDPQGPPQLSEPNFQPPGPQSFFPNSRPLPSSGPNTRQPPEPPGILFRQPSENYNIISTLLQFGMVIFGGAQACLHVILAFNRLTAILIPHQYRTFWSGKSFYAIISIAFIIPILSYFWILYYGANILMSPVFGSFVIDTLRTPIPWLHKATMTTVIVTTTCLMTFTCDFLTFILPKKRSVIKNDPSKYQQEFRLLTVSVAFLIVHTLLISNIRRLLTHNFYSAFLKAMSLASLEPWTNLQIDEIYHPIFQRYMKIIFLLLFALECFLFPLTVFIILKKSTKEMGNYKYLLIYHLTCSFIYRIFLFIFSPVFLFPLPVVYCDTFLNIGTNYIFHYFAFGSSTFIAAMHALLISFAYRAGATFISGPIHYYIKNHFLLISSNFIGVSIVITLFSFPIISGAGDTLALQALFTADVPMLAQIFQQYPLSSGFHPKYTSKMLKLFLYDGIGAAILLPLSFTAIHFTFLHRIKILEKQLSSATFKLHLMLYRALTIQLAATTILFFIPFGLFVLTYLLQTKEGSIYANIIMASGGTEMIANALIILYFIKPYRNYVLKIFKKLVKIERRKTVMIEARASVTAITRIK